MCRRVIQCRCLPIIFIDMCNDLLAYFKGTVFTFANMGKGFTLFASVFDNKVCTRRINFTLITDLTTGFSIKRSVIQNDNALLTGMQFVDIFAINQQGSDHAFITHMIVTTENSFTINNQRFGQTTTKLTGAAGTIALCFHMTFKTCNINRQTTFAGNIGR